MSSLNSEISIKQSLAKCLNYWYLKYLSSLLKICFIELLYIDWDFENIKAWFANTEILNFKFIKIFWLDFANFKLNLLSFYLLILM